MKSPQAFVAKFLNGVNRVSISSGIRFCLTKCKGGALRTGTPLAPFNVSVCNGF